MSYAAKKRSQDAEKSRDLDFIFEGNAGSLSMWFQCIEMGLQRAS
jgi:hypothetical protein